MTHRPNSRLLFCAATLLGVILAGSALAAGPACSAAPPGSYGDAPATIQPDSALATAGVEPACNIAGSQRLGWTDADGTARYACLLVPPNASLDTPLPLLVWLHASKSPPNSITATSLNMLYRTANLSGDASRLGFLLLLPAGRDISHYYPANDETGLGWDNWYRNLDRSSRGLNADVAAIDHFIAVTKATGLVDAQRVYLSGWSNGAAMAQLYALNTPGIAAAAVYSSAAPYSDVDDPCAQTPFATRLTPLLDIHNDCDLFAFCQSGARFHGELARLFPALVQQHIVIDSQQRDTAQCNARCANPYRSPMQAKLRHVNWPLQRNDDILGFLRDHPLP